MAVLDDMEGGVVTQKTIDHLQKTTGWMKFFAILGMIGMGLYAISILISLPDLFSAGFGGILMVLVAGTVAGGYIYTYVLLLGYANKLTELTHTKSANVLEQAMDKQRQYWFIQGVLFISIIVFLLVMYFLIRSNPRLAMALFR